MPQPRRKRTTRTVRYLRQVGTNWPGSTTETDPSSARWLVERGIAEDITGNQPSSAAPPDAQRIVTAGVGIDPCPGGFPTGAS